jgi:hypothetical protein
MALTAVKFELVNKSLANKEIDFDSDTIKCALLSAYTPDASATGHQYWSQVKAAGTEAVGTGYTAGGVTLTSVTWTQTGGVRALKGTIPAWNTTGGSLAVYHDTVAAASRVMLVTFAGVGSCCRTGQDSSHRLTSVSPISRG